MPGTVLNTRTTAANYGSPLLTWSLYFSWNTCDKELSKDTVSDGDESCGEKLSRVGGREHWAKGRTVVLYQDGQGRPDEVTCEQM